MAGLAPEPGTLPSGLVCERVSPAVSTALLAGPLRRMLDGVQALGPVARVPGRALTAELWGAEAPLWANPLLQLELPAARRSVEWRVTPRAVVADGLFHTADEANWREAGLALVRDELPGLRTVADLGALGAWITVVDQVRCSRVADHASLLAFAAAHPERGAAVLAAVRRALAGSSGWDEVMRLGLYHGAVPLAVLEGAPGLLRVRSSRDPLYTAVVVMCMALPHAWRAASPRNEQADRLALRPLRLRPQAGERAAVVEILRLVGWQLPCVVTPVGWKGGHPGLRSSAAPLAPLPVGAGGPRWVGFADGPGVVGRLTCKLAVAIQLRPVVDVRRTRRAATVDAALALDLESAVRRETLDLGREAPLEAAPRATDAQVCAGLRGLEAVVPVLWRLPLLNARKESIWRLWVSGFHKQAALGVPECPCGWRCDAEDGPGATAWRAHVFWGCPVAEAVVVAVAAALPAPTPVVTCCQVWLLQPPAGVRAGVWAVVAALVVDAMERGRRHLWRITRPRDGVPLDRAVAVERAGELATADLWDALASFAEGGVVPRGWGESVGSTHPFVGVVDGRLTLNKMS
jgi:hypothetical protein